MKQYQKQIRMILMKIKKIKIIMKIKVINISKIYYQHGQNKNFINLILLY